MSATGRIPVYSVYNSYRHSPLALGMIISAARIYKGGLLRELYDFIPTTLTSVDVAAEVVGKHGPGVFLCSDYLWTSRQNVEIGRFVKQAYPGSVTIHGGPSVPKYDYGCQSFFDENPHVDVAVRGEGEMAAAEVLEQLAADRRLSPPAPDRLGSVAGITFRSSATGEIIRTIDRERAGNLDDLPSPYVSDWFTAADARQWVAAIVETNRGCPYGCTFCDWGSATLSKIRQFSLDRVRAEIEWIARNGVGVLWIADANFGIFTRDVEIAKIIAECRRKYDCPRQVVVNYAKNATERLAEIIQVLQDAGIAADPIISIQTRDPETLAIIDRSNIKTERYEQLIGIFRDRNLPVSSDLMIGLPGATVASFKADLQFFFDRKVYAKAYPTMVLPNSPMAHRDYIAKYQIKTDKDGYIVSTSTFTRLDRWTMQSIYFFYRVFVGFSVLKYFLYWLQIDHGIPALTFIDDAQQAFNDRPGELPYISAAVRPMLTRDPANPWTRAISDWSADDCRRFHDEIAGFVSRQYGIASDSALRTVLAAQAALMPRRNRVLPETVALEHDIAAYFQAVRTVDKLTDGAGSELTPLADYGPGTLTVLDPSGLCQNVTDDKVMYDDHRIDWELTSELLGARARHFVAQA